MSSTLYSKNYKLSFMETTLAERIKIIMAEVGPITADAFGKSIGVSGMTVGNWLNEIHLTIKSKHAEAIRDVHGYAMEWTQTGRGSKKISPTIEDEGAPAKFRIAAEKDAYQNRPSKIELFLENASTTTRKTLEEIALARANRELEDEDMRVLRAMANRLARKK